MQVRDGRSLLGGAALVIAGAILSVMTYLYLEERITGVEILRARWLWEIILNLQILCIGCMWFCYAERIRLPDKARARQMKLRMIVGLWAVLLPVWLLLLFAFMGWLERLPPKGVIDIIFIAMVGYWIVVTVIPRLLLAPRDRRGLLFRRLKKIWHVTPMLIAMLVFIADMIRGTFTYYILVPILFYSQSAMAYILSGLGLVTPDD